MAHNELPDFNQLWNYADPAATEQQFRELLPQAEASGDRAYHAELLTQIARALGLQRKFDDAHRILDMVEPMLEDGMERARIRYELERGRVFNSSGERDAARPHFLRAWELGQQAKEEFYAIDAAHMMGIIEPPDAALAWNEKAIALAGQTQDQRAKGWLGPLTNNTGWTYHDNGDYDRALEYFEKCLHWHRERNTGRGLRIAQWTVARALRSLGRTGEALEQQQALLKEYEESGGSDGYVYEEIGECLHTLGRTEEARPYFAKAYDLLGTDEWLKANEAPRLERLREMGAGA